MNTEWKQLYGSMQEEIACAKLKHPDMRLQLELCFHVSERYWGIIEKEMEGYIFKNIKEEIRFYKHIKPIFVSEIRYYRLLYFLVHFEPIKEIEVKDFWLRELQRYDKFIRDNSEFCAYYKSGSTDRDEEFFTKPLAEDENIRLTQYDILASTLLAMEKYAAHIKKLIKL